MDIFRHFGRAFLVFLVIWVWGCDDKKTVEPPPQPPQITLQRISGMESDDVFDVFVDTQNRLWLSTEAGVYMYQSSQGPFPPPSDASRVTRFTDRDGLPNLRCRELEELNGKVFLATWGGGIGIYEDAPPWLTVGPDDGLVSGPVFSLARDDTSIWVATVQGVCQYIENEAPDPADRVIDRTDIFGDSEFSSRFSSIMALTGVGGKPDSGEVWVSQMVGDSLGVRLPGGIKFLGLPALWFQTFRTATSGIPSDNVLEVSYDPTRNLVWSVHSGIGVATVDLAAKTWTTYTTVDGLMTSSVAVNHLGTKWPVGTVWVATQEGVSKIEPGGNIVNYGYGSGLPTLRVRKVVVDRNDDVWLCFSDAGAAKVVP